jgi:hypothetical protein
MKREEIFLSFSDAEIKYKDENGAAVGHIL